MTIAVITPISEEFHIFTEAFDKLWHGHDVREDGRIQVYDYREGEFIVAQGGWGKVQFAVATQHLLDNLSDPSLVVCAGVAGSLTKTASVGDVVIATDTVEHDFNSSSPDAQLRLFNGSVRHVAVLRRRASSIQSSFRVHFARIASGDESIKHSSRANELHSRTGALAVAWEGAGGARAAAFSGVHYIEIRGITDMADHNAPSTWMDNLPDAVRNAAVIVAAVTEYP